jgi:hypothetical protein
VIEADSAGDQKSLSDFDGAIEKGLTGPGALEQTALVFEDRVENPEPAPGRQQSFGNDAPDAGDLVSYSGLGQRCDCRCIEIAERNVPQQVSRRVHAEPRERLGPPFPDALQEFDGGV